MEVLSRREEETLFKAHKKEALQACDPVVKEFAACSFGRTISLAWSCRDKWRTMQECMKVHMSEESLDNAKLEYIAKRRQQSPNAQTRI